MSISSEEAQSAAAAEGWVEAVIEAAPDQQELLIAKLEAMGFYAFEQEPVTLRAYHTQAGFDRQALADVLEQMEPHLQGINAITPQNWNRLWEENCPSVAVEGFCQLVPTHDTPQSGFVHTIRFAPKMAFGTGHHASTRAMIRLMRGLSLQGRRVLDLGCGTGVLGILAYRMGAQEAAFVDNSVYAVENTRENLALNEMPASAVEQAELETWHSLPYDGVLANINRNALVNYAQTIAQWVSPDGDLLLSGFYQADAPEVQQAFAAQDFAFQAHADELEWRALHLKRR
jgi:ribosomal protein L11 methyltransferase